MSMVDKLCRRRTERMTDRKQPSPETGRKLKDIFVNLTGETTTTERQDHEQETNKKVLDDTPSEAS